MQVRKGGKINQVKCLRLLAKESKARGDLAGFTGKETPGNTENELGCQEILGRRGAGDVWIWVALVTSAK